MPSNQSLDIQMTKTLVELTIEANEKLVAMT